MNGPHQTGDVYKCSINRRNNGCSKLNLGRISLTNVSERKDKMRLGMTLTSNPVDNSFVACGPLWSYECGSSYYSTGICSRVNASFKFSRTIAPAFQRCETYMDIVIVLDGSNSIYPWYEVQAFLINILQKFYIGPGQIQVGVLQYGEKVVHEFKLSDYKSVEEVVKRARSINQRGGEETNTALGINVARSQAFKHGGRRGAKKVMIVITDGESHDSADLQQVIKDCEKDGITRYAIAVLGYYNRRGINPEAFLNEIKYIASDPDDKHFFNVTDEAALKDIVDALGERIFSLEGTSKNGTAFGLQMSQAGFSAHNVEDGILVGAVGAYDWNGGVLKETRQGKVVPPKSSYSLEFPEELKNHGAYLGYTVTSVVSARNGRLIVAGAPRFNHTGKVIIFTLKNSGELTILHSLKGQQIGSYYGSEIAPVDIDGDGITDNLLVAAPMFFSGGLEKGKVYIYRLTELNRFILEGALEIHNGGQNARFGSALAPVPDVNGDGFNDLVVGAPLEDDHKGAIYVFFSQQSRILRKYKQRIAAADLAPGLQYFGRSIHGTMDMNNDGSVDLAVGSLGAVVLLWSRSVIRIYTTVRFEPSKINIFVKDCQRGGKDVTCMSAIVCLNVTARTAIPPAQEIGIKYNVSIAERRFNPRAVLDNPAKLQPQNLTLLPGVETCKHIYFHVMETTDYARPIVFVVQVGLQGSDHGPVLDDSWPTVMRTELPFWNGCDEDERCMPDLALQSTTDLMTRKQFCAQPVHSHGVFCRHQSEGRSEGLWRIIEGNRRRMVVDVRLENKGENAYSARLNITYTPNLRFSSLIVKDTSDIKIDCYAEIKPRNEKICNVSAPFMRAKSQVSFRLEFEFSPTVVLDHVRVVLEANSDGEETNAADNSEEIYYSLNYEADLLFTRESHPSRYDIKSELALEEPGVIGPPFNLTFQIQNLGYFPVRDLQLNIEIPEMSKNGNRLLQISDFYIDKRDGTGCLPPQHAAPSRMATDELSHVSNQVDTLNLPFQCRVNVASRRDVAVRISGVMRIDNLHALQFRIFQLVASASVELSSSSPMFLPEERPVRHIILEIRKEGDQRVPTWIIIGSTLGGLLLLALLILALWKLGFFQRQKRRDEDEPAANGKVSEER
ncbi:integrin alpha-11a isoform X2 [Takifugu rubripes]|nr:integrin alpha-11 isoform X2 [Takifugu rubripes]XP_011608269.1 integrin alpha-11 isoform X2 [Takifugu rubripes]XP_011608270.1 integrin alpha-11 isoform X2 [Takifugu rubripes]XP_029702447.1 integrin alpha-11 isoform X2 [Takifugu rubripes]|eukprot:XP_011608268.1 PREDICTED: integrin alpha-11 isoform X2 [Takifugu rubripes]